VIKNKYASYPD